MKLNIALFVTFLASVEAFSFHSNVKSNSKKSTSLFPQGSRSKVLEPLGVASITNAGDASETGLKVTQVVPTTKDTTTTTTTTQSLNDGKFTFKTKFGYLNPYAVFYGFFSIFYAIPWYSALTVCQIMYKLTNNTWDKMRRVPVLLNQTWLEFVMTTGRAMPKIENREILDEFYKEGRAAMFVANHNSWMDIPFMCMTVGYKVNHKIIAKAELSKVPILGKAIDMGGHVKVNRGDRKSQIATLKTGMKWLKNGVHLCAFPEGTRSKDGRMLPFKNGGFKMASKVGAPIIPLSIVSSGKCHPSDWMFPRSRGGRCRVVIHKPIESNDKTEDELAEQVRASIIGGLPKEQRPLE